MWIPAEVWHPGDYLRDELAKRETTAADFAAAINRPAQMVSEIMNAKKRVTAETAIQFENELGISALTWLNLQAQWDLHIARQTWKRTK